jgi:Lon protease-like protein
VYVGIFFRAKPDKRTMSGDDASLAARLRDILECPLCCSTLVQPITTACGHSFCRACLRRATTVTSNFLEDAQSSDPRSPKGPRCPLCRAGIGFVSPDHPQNVLLSRLISELGGDSGEKAEAGDKSQTTEETDNDGEDWFTLPLFLLGSECLFPGQPLPLHVFEPRYRRMIQDCMAGSGRFGIVPVRPPVAEEPIDSDGEGDGLPKLAGVGTTAHILGVRQIPGGRLIVSTVGESRFVVRPDSVRWSDDGYAVAEVSYALSDDPEDLSPLAGTCERLLTRVQESAGTLMAKIEEQFPPPSVSDAPKFLWWVAAVCQLRPQDQLEFLQKTSVLERAEWLEKNLPEDPFQASQPSSCLIS